MPFVYTSFITTETKKNTSGCIIRPPRIKMIESWRKQFSLKQLSLEHDRPITFIVSQWQKESKPSTIYLIYRWIVALIFLITFILSLLDLKHPEATFGFRAKWLIYLTNWGYTACTFQALLAATLLSISIAHKPTTLLAAYKTYWVVNVVATVVGFGITAIYWSLIYDEKTMEFDAMNFIFHGNNSIMLMVDLFIVSHPIRLLHCFYSIIFGLCYAIFSIIYYVAGGTSRANEVFIYKILDWRKPGITTATCFAIFGFSIIMHIFVWGLYKLRMWIHATYYKRDDQTALGTDPEPCKTAYINQAMASDVV